VRIVVATNRHLMDMLRKGLIREDFLYRIHVTPVTLPPLRDRKEDIVLLVDHFLKLYGNGKKRPTMPGRILNALYSHDWPGNIRELENVLKRYLTTNSFSRLSPFTQIFRLPFLSVSPVNSQPLKISVYHIITRCCSESHLDGTCVA
jgi:transcriptional regulator with PAS, ATPase and Fis domain